MHILCFPDKYRQDIESFLLLYLVISMILTWLVVLVQLFMHLSWVKQLMSLLIMYHSDGAYSVEKHSKYKVWIYKATFTELLVRNCP